MFVSMSATDYKNICDQELIDIEEALLCSGLLSQGKSLADFMKGCRFADEEETVYDVFSRTTSYLAAAGERFYGPEGVEIVQDLFLDQVCHFNIILGSPILTNAGRRLKKSVSACSIPPVKLSRMNPEEISKMVGDYHKRGVGTGFCFDDLESPIEMIKFLNHVAISEVQAGHIERSVGNMGVLSIDHPKVLDFIRVKTDHPEIKEWKFNLSVNVTRTFIEAWQREETFRLTDGREVDPKKLMYQIAKDAHATGDPGLIFMDRINEVNKLPHVGHYKTVVPCGEVSLFEGEVCQFAYLNLSRFVADGEIELDSLREAVRVAVVLLDNAVESNIENMPNSQSAEIINRVRRIGIGVCGFSEMLHAMGLPYGSDEGRRLAANLMSFINFESKRASVELAKVRGPFHHFNHPETRRELFIKPFKEKNSDFVSTAEWDKLENDFEKYGIRNLSTTILPPSGRSSIVAGVTASIEPPFRLVADRRFKKALRKQCQIHGCHEDLPLIFETVKNLGSLQGTSLPNPIKEIFKTALEIAPEDHILMTAAFQEFTDEGISKTVNLPEQATIDDVVHIYNKAYQVGLKGVTIYRDGCRKLQPKALGGHSKKTLSIIDPIYGPFNVTERILGLLESPLLKRLKRVHQNGANFLIDPRQATSRYEHSLGTLALTQFLGGDESVQVAALLHDISHTAFSHVADFVFANKDQNFHDLARKKFFESDFALETIEKFGITAAELACEAIPLIKGKNLNVDRLDYCIRDLSAVNRIYHPQYSSILNNLVVDTDGEIKCRDIGTARLIFAKFIEVNLEVYFNPKAEAAGLILSTILKRLLERGDIEDSDLFSTDDAIIAKIKCSPFAKVFETINPSIEPVAKPNGILPLYRKLRYLDPQVLGLEGKLTDYCTESRKILSEYLKTPTTVHYNLPECLL